MSNTETSKAEQSQDHHSFRRGKKLLQKKLHMSVAQLGTANVIMCWENWNKQHSVDLCRYNDSSYSSCTDLFLHHGGGLLSCWPLKTVDSFPQRYYWFVRLQNSEFREGHHKCLMFFSLKMFLNSIKLSHKHIYQYQSIPLSLYWCISPSMPLLMPLYWTSISLLMSHSLDVSLSLSCTFVSGCWASGKCVSEWMLFLCVFPNGMIKLYNFTGDCHNFLLFTHL